MTNLIVVLLGGLSGERKISFLTGKACSYALKKKGYKGKFIIPLPKPRIIWKKKF